MAPAPPRSDLAPARRALSEGRLRDVQALCRRALGIDPSDAAAWTLLGQAALMSGALKEAEEFLGRAVAASDRSPEAHAFQARLHFVRNDPLAARQAAERAWSRLPKDRSRVDVEALDSLAVVFNRTGAHAQARELFRSATQGAPKRSGLWLNLGWSEQHMGDLAASEAAFRKAIEADPRNDAAYSALVGMVKQTEDNNFIPQLEKLFGATTDPERRLHIGHALAKTHEDMGDPASAMAWLLKAKAGKAAQVKNDADADAEMLKAAIEIARPPFAAPAEAPLPRPLFVLGLPRSGTTLVDRILSSHPEVQSLGEPPTLGLLVRQLARTGGRRLADAAILRAAAAAPAQHLAALGEAYRRQSRAAWTTDGQVRWLIDKTPLNVIYAGLILKALPEARIICLRRDPMDSCLAIFRQKFTTRFNNYDFTFDLEQTARFVKGFNDLADHLKATLPPERYAEAVYEQMVEDQEGETRRLLDFCGLPFDPACLDFHENKAPVDSASAAQVRRPIYRSSVGRWRAYGEAMETARAILQP